MSHTQEAYGQQRRLLTREEVAEQLGVSPRTVARLTERGELAYVRLGRLARFRPTDVADLVDARLNKEVNNDEDPGLHSGVSAETSTAGRGHRVPA